MTDWATNPQPVGKNRWRFPTPSELPDGDLATLGGDLEPSTIIDAYRRGDSTHAQRSEDEHVSVSDAVQ